MATLPSGLLKLFAYGMPVVCTLLSSALDWPTCFAVALELAFVKAAYYVYAELLLD